MKQGTTKYGNPYVVLGLTEQSEFERRDGSRDHDYLGSFKFRPKGSKEEIMIVISVSNSTIELDNGKRSRLAKVTMVENQVDKRFSRR
jgi:hypothetical protein